MILGSIFVNYRRQDSEGEAGRLFDELEKHFGEKSVFMDVAGIEPGQDFRKAIDQSVASCSVLLAVIGQQWLDAADGAGSRRLDDPADFVRIELASALRINIPVMPVLVRGARMPRPEELPDDLKDLAYRNAVELTHARWKSDIQFLLRALRPYIEPPAPAAASEPAETLGPSTPPRRTETVGAVDATAVGRASRELARYLGPIANVIVKRAASRSASADELFATVAREIVSDADRIAFLRSCRG